MAYTFRYSLDIAPAARNDGSSCIDHQVHAESSPDGTNWSVIPDRGNKTICIPGAALKVVMDMPHATTPQKQAKALAYKVALAANLDTAPVAIVGWDSASLTEMMTANDLATAQAILADTFLRVVMGLTYPIRFGY